MEMLIRCCYLVMIEMAIVSQENGAEHQTGIWTKLLLLNRGVDNSLHVSRNLWL